ncbi:hypothetical protein PG993_013572 [Apiospora rasikravindrae]|uniref:Uncharacterized protein n=1 Tax=Apiospora rasikravindrae TaxID=990691 RepID=A0ABR1RZE4_9PEZI
MGKFEGSRQTSWTSAAMTRKTGHQDDQVKKKMVKKKVAITNPRLHVYLTPPTPAAIVSGVFESKSSRGGGRWVKWGDCCLLSKTSPALAKSRPPDFDFPLKPWMELAYLD